MSAELAGITVVVTRPAHQSAAITAALEARGARVIRFPAIRIEALDFDAGSAAPVPDEHDWVVYTSVNAVAQGLARLAPSRRARIAAIGPATARALEAAGLRVDARPRTGADSEGLLALPEFAAPRGLRMLVLRGRGGRELLRTELERRGASVQVAELYQRLPVVPAPADVALLAAALAGPSPYVAVNSVDLLQALAGIVPAGLGPALRAAALVVPGARVAAAARAAGWRGAIVEAASAEDGAMIGAIVTHAGRGSAAKDA